MVLDGHIHIMDELVDPQGLLARMRTCGVDGGLLISLPPRGFFPNGLDLPSKKRLDNLMAWGGESMSLFFWIDPLDEDAIDQVDVAARRGVAGFKVICDRFYPGDERAMPVYRRMASLGLPVMFHSGILWDGKVSSKYNRPVEFEALLDVPGLRFAMAHIGWPWSDEMIALYGKLAEAKKRRTDTPVELFVDLTPGTPPIYREEVLTRLMKAGYDVRHNVYFGSDCLAGRYDTQWTDDWLRRDRRILSLLEISSEDQENLFWRNLERFLRRC